jgi:hypothetical protein
MPKASREFPTTRGQFDDCPNLAWLDHPGERGPSRPEPARAELAEAVRLTARTLAEVAPGASVEVRVPSFVAVQCISGPSHTRGNPPNVVEADPRTWLLLATGLLEVTDAATSGALQLSGSRAGEVASLLPVVTLPD